MRTVNFKIPDSVDLDDKDIAMLVASILYEKGKLSLGQAAKWQDLPSEHLLNSLESMAYQSLTTRQLT